MTEKIKNKKKNKVLRVISLAIMVLSLILLSYTLIMKLTNRVPRLLGYSFHIVVTPSMEPEIMVYDFIVAKKTDIQSITDDDYIVFKSPDPTMKGRIIVHKVESFEDINGERFFTTKGIANLLKDKYPVSESGVIGIYNGKSNVLSTVVRGVVTAVNFLLAHFNIVFIVIIGASSSVAIYLGFRTYKIFKEEKNRTAEPSESPQANGSEPQTAEPSEPPQANGSEPRTTGSSEPPQANGSEPQTDNESAPDFEPPPHKNDSDRNEQ